MAKRYEKKKEAARMVRQQQEREQKRKQLLLTSGIVAVVVVLAGVVGIGIYLNQGYPVNQPKAETADGALVLSEGPVTVDLYEDFICPVCKDFQDSTGAQLQAYADAGHITMKFHPLGLLNSYSSTKYSSRSAAAAVCAADEDKFTEYEQVLFANQPPEGSAGLTDDELISLGSQAGLGDSFATCVTDETYRGWVDEITNNATADGITSTPTVMVDGETIEDKSTVLARIDAALEAAGVDLSTDEESADDSDSDESNDTPDGDESEKGTKEDNDTATTD